MCNKSILCIPLVTIIMFNACVRKPVTTIEYTNKLAPSDTIIINFPDSIPRFINSKNYQNYKGIFSFLSEEENGDIILNTYHIATNKWERKCFSCFNKFPIEYNGPYSFINDSIVLYMHSYKNELLLININQNMVQKNIPIDKDISFSYSEKISAYIDDSVMRIPVLSKNMIEKDFFRESPIGLEINVFNSEIAKKFAFPANTNLTIAHSNNLILPKIIFLQNEIVASFKNDDRIFQIHDSTNKYRVISNPGQNVSSGKDYLFNNDENFIQTLKIELSGIYKNLVYDALTEQFYRIMVTYPSYRGQIPASFESLEPILKSRTVRVSVMDKYLKEIACNEIKGVTEFMCFASNGKLYMLEDDKENTDDIERFIGFELTEL